MSLNREQIDTLSNTYLIGLYEEMERQAIADIARRVAKTGRFTETAEIMARNMREQGYSPDRIRKEVMRSLEKNEDMQKAIAEDTRAYKQEIKKIIEETEKEALEAGDMLVATAGTMAWNDDMQMWNEHGVSLKKDNTFSQLVKAYQKQTEGELKNITRSTGMYGSKDMSNAYRRTLDLSLIKMSTGTTTYYEAVKDTIMALARDGMTVLYPSGKRYSLDSAVRMCLRTGYSQLAGKITEQNMNKTKTDLVYVDAHAGSRPEHAVWQGQVYVYNTENESKYPDYGNFWDETDYGSPTGLKGVNCTHNFWPHWEGDPIPEYVEPDPMMIDGKEYTMYEATQEQRKQERAIRQTKRELNAAKALGKDGEQLAAQLQRKLSWQISKYNQFSQSANLRPKTERLMAINENNNKELQGKNFAKAVDLFSWKESDVRGVITPDSVMEEMAKSEVGREMIQYLSEIGTTMYFDYETWYPNARAYTDPETLEMRLFVKSLYGDVTEAACSVIHECTHRKYGLFDCQWAEAHCFANELMHKKNRTLTAEEKKRVVKLAKDNYGEYNWRKSGRFGYNEEYKIK